MTTLWPWARVGGLGAVALSAAAVARLAAGVGASVPGGTRSGYSEVAVVT